MKLLNRAVNSIGNRKQAYHYNATVDAIKKRVDTARFEAVREKYRKPDSNFEDRRSYFKYFDLDPVIRRDYERVRQLDLEHSPPKRILDIGCGFGYFMLACSHFGHQPLGLDFEDPNVEYTKMFGEVCALLGQKRQLHKIERFEPLPEMGEPFDFITAHQICFTNFNQPDRWDVPEWKYFLPDLATHLTPDGKVLFRFSLPEKEDRYFSEPLEAYFLSLGADIQGSVVRFDRSQLPAA